MEVQKSASTAQSLKNDAGLELPADYEVERNFGLGLAPLGLLQLREEPPPPCQVTVNTFPDRIRPVMDNFAPCFA